MADVAAPPPAAPPAPAPAPAAPKDTKELFLEFLQSSFQQQLNKNSLISSLVTSLGISAAIFLGFCFIRPHNSIVYAPKLRATGGKRPPKLPSGIFAWFRPLMAIKEDELLDIVGLDAVVFLRFLRMCRNIFGVLGILSCSIIIPINVITSKKKSQWKGATRDPMVLMTPQMAWGEAMWAHVVMAYIFCFIIMFFLWRNYDKLCALKQRYFLSSDYQKSIHARSLMVADVPKVHQSSIGLARIVGASEVPFNGDEVCAIGRDLKGLPNLIEMHEVAVRKLEAVLAKYLKDPNNLPRARPEMKPFKDDKSVPKHIKVDAIQYLNDRIKTLEKQVYTVRQSIDSRNSTHYGFVSYPTIAQAHLVAQKMRGVSVEGASVQLAPLPQDIMWTNLRTSKAKRRTNTFTGYLFFAGLSILYIVPNALMATFLSNISRIGQLWQAFDIQLKKNPGFWGFIQGVGVPLLTSLIYLLLPIVMRKLSTWQGELTKTSREMHVTTKLYFFFVFNNLVIFTLFSTFWAMGVFIYDDMNKKNSDFFQAVHNFAFRDKMTSAVVSISPFWIMYLLQRNLGAVLDLAQLVSLFWGSFSRHFLSPTPRQIIERSAPPNFGYAAYYNYFLFYSTIALCFATLQPVVLLVAFLYFLVDEWLKKYQILYIFVTKTESGGQFWRILFNRFISAMALAFLTLAIVVWAQSYRDIMAWAMVPLGPILIGFKFAAHRHFDRKMEYFQANLAGDNALKTKGEGEAVAHGRLERRFGHPALSKPLLKPMVHAKAQHILPQLGLGVEPVAGHDRGIPLDDLTNTDPHNKKGKRVKKQKSGMFQIVNDSQLDFTEWAHAPEFADQLAAANGTEIDSLRSAAGTPSGSRPVSRVGSPAPGFQAHSPNSRSVSPAPHYTRPGPGLLPHFPSNDPAYMPLNSAPSPLPSPYPYGDNSRPVTPSYEGLDASAHDAYGQNLLAGPPPGGRGPSGYMPQQRQQSPSPGPSYGHASGSPNPYEEYRKGGGGGNGGQQGWR